MTCGMRNAALRTSLVCGFISYPRASVKSAFLRLVLWNTQPENSVSEKMAASKSALTKSQPDMVHPVTTLFLAYMSGKLQSRILHPRAVMQKATWSAL